MAKILLVEDDNNLREIYEARLQAEGYTIISAMDGEEALVLAKKEKPDLVISDVMMPRISGFEMLDILRNTEGLKEVKVIMLTALGQAEDKTRADSLGADRYLVKSQVTLEDIVRAAQELLGPADNTPAPAVTPTPGNEPAAVPAPAIAPAATPTVAPPTPAAPATPQVVPVAPAPSAIAAAAPTPQAPQAPAPTQASVPASTPAPSVQPVATSTPTPPSQEPPAGVPTPTNPPTPPATTPPALEPTPAPATQQSSATPTAEPAAAPAPVASPATSPQEPVVEPPAPTAPQPETPAPIPSPDIAIPSTQATPPEEPTASNMPVTPAPTPTPTAVQPEQPMPAVTPEPTSSTGQPQAQSASAEEAAIKAQIENFVSQNSQTAPKPEALDKAMMANAIKDLTSTNDTHPTINANPKPRVISPVAPSITAPTPQPAPAATPAPGTPGDKDDDGVSIAHKKVIQPINDTAPTAPDLNELLAKEGISSLDDAPTPQPNQSYGVSPAPTAPAPAPAQTPSGAPSYNTPHPPGHVISPNNNPSGVDPNSIAL